MDGNSYSGIDMSEVGHEFIQISLPATTILLDNLEFKGLKLNTLLAI